MMPGGGDGVDDKVDLLFSGQQYKKFQESYYSPILEKYSLNLIDVRVLLFLVEHEDYDTAKDIVRIHCLAKSYVSKSIDKLIEKGFLEGVHLKEDRRYIHLLVTQKAFPVIQAMREQRKKMLQKLFDGISDEEVLMLRRVAARISTNITEMEGLYEQQF